MQEENIRTIKKYQNRKLYDTKDSCYITLDDIANLIKKGEEIRVIDNRTKNDVTSVILTQILVDQEKSAKSVLPMTMLRDIIRQGKGSLGEFISRYVVASINSQPQRAAEAQRYIDQLITRGDISKIEGKDLLSEVLEGENSAQVEVDAWLGQRVTRSLKEVTKISDLETHIRALNDKINSLESKLSGYEAR